MQWTVHGRRTIYDSPWIAWTWSTSSNPTGTGSSSMSCGWPAPVAATVITDGEGRALLMWRHRHVTDTWGWEIASGRIEVGESPERGGRTRSRGRETGWRPGPLRSLVASQPSNGSVNTVRYIFHGQAAKHVGNPVDRSEAERVGWVPVRRSAA